MQNDELKLQNFKSEDYKEQKEGGSQDEDQKLAEIKSDNYVWDPHLPLEESPKKSWDEVPHEKLPFFRKWLRLFTPFHLMMKKKHQPDAFYFPQSFIAGVTLSFVSIFYMAI